MARHLLRPRGDRGRLRVGRGEDRGARRRPGAASESPGDWKAHQEKDLHAVLSLPTAYKRLYETGVGKGPSRQVVYGSADGRIAVALIQWDEAPGSLQGQAEQPELWGEYEHSTPQYTRTTFDGEEAVLADTTYDPDGRPTRVLKLVVRTDTDRMYELRVSMPKGTPEEKKGAAVFQGARDRLEIESD